MEFSDVCSISWISPILGLDVEAAAVEDELDVDEADAVLDEHPASAEIMAAVRIIDVNFFM
jgi:hypothetical protein